MTTLEPIAFDRSTGRITGGGLRERAAVAALQLGAKASAGFAHRGYSVGARLVGSCIARRDVVVRLADDAAFAFPLADGYWSKLLDRGFVYEEEIDHFLRHVAPVDYAFVDCGANFGFWSVLVTSRDYGGHRAVAIEASPVNGARLADNAARNGGRFSVLNRAISGVSGGTVRIAGRKHEALSIVDAGDGGDEVAVISLDSLLDDGVVPPGAKLVVKLDVEGVEIAAIKGGARLLAGDAVMICEEHGSDRDHTVTRFLMNETPYRVFMLDPATGKFERIVDIAALDRLKITTWMGYNVFATASRFWEEQLLAAKPLATH